MKRLSLSQACLLHASGELGPEASKRLLAHIQANPSAMVEHDLVAGRYACLQSLPSLADELDQVSLERIRQNIVGGVLEKRRAHRRREIKRKLRPVYYRFMSIASGVAAALVVMAAIHVVQVRAQARAQQLSDAETTFQELAQTNLPARRSFMLRRMSWNRYSADGGSGIAASAPNGSSAILQFLDALDRVRLNASSSISSPQ